MTTAPQFKNKMERVQKLLPILDNGHGIDTPGKRSPLWKNGAQVLEYEFNRDIVKRIAQLMDEEGIKYHILTPETIDISLGERVRRANRVTSQHGGNAFLVSVHANAGGGSGWEAYTSVGKTKADAMATIFYKVFEENFKGCKIRKDYSDGDPDKESQFYILKHTTCPAILTENFFMDNAEDCAYIASESGRENIARAHFEAIKQIIY